MPDISTCPSAEALQRFLLGKSVGPESATLERHLEECDHCVRAAAGLATEDRLLATARDVHAAPLDAPPLAELIDGLVEYGSGLIRVPHPLAGTTTQAEDTEEFWPPLLAPPQAEGELGRLGDYRILEVLGRGGMGVVFRAEDLQLRRPAALKLLRPGRALATRQRFLAEARAAAAVRHPQVVTIYHVGEDRGVPYLAMELLEGESLHERLQRQRSLPLAEVVRIGRAIAAGLAAAHTRGLTHRDIKPANIWLDSAHGTVKILDFGLARSLEEPRLTQSGQVIGTPAYMAPEQGAAGPVDARADLFSLGCVLYEMTTGVAPFARPDTMATLIALASFEPGPLTQQRAEVPQGLSDLVARLLAKKPADRPPSAEAVRLALADIERGLAAAALSGPHAAGAGMRPARRSPWLAVTTLMATLAIMLASVTIIIRNRDGGVTKLEVPDGSTVRVDADGKVTIAARPEGRPPEELSPYDKLRRTDIAPSELRLAGDGDPAKAAPELVAVLGDSRWQHAEFNSHGLRMAVYSPDGSIIASGSSDNRIRIWDAATGEQRRAFHIGWVPSTLDGSRLGFQHDGQRLYMWDGRKLRCWDPHTGEEHAPPIKHGQAIPAFSKDGKIAATVALDGEIRVWGGLGERLVASLQGDPGAGIVLSPQGDHLVFRKDKRLRLWNIAQGKETAVWKLGAQAASPTGWSDRLPAALPAAISPDGARLAVCDNAGNKSRTYVWNLEQKKLEHTLARDGSSWAASFSRDGRYLIVLGTPAPFQVWDLDTGKVHSTIAGHQPQDQSTIAFAPDKLQLASFGGILSDARVRLWNLNGRELSPPRGNLGALQAMRLAHGEVVAASHNFSTFALAQQGAGLALKVPCFHTDFCISPDGRRLAQVAGSEVRVYDTRTGLLSQTFSGARIRRDTQLAVSPDWHYLAIAGDNVHVWDVASGKEHRLDLPAASGGPPIVPLVFTNDRKLIVAAPAGKVQVWDPASGKVEQTLDVGANITWRAFPTEHLKVSPDGKLLAVSPAADNKPISLIHLGTGSRVKQFPAADWFAFSPDSRTVATAQGNKVRLWDLGSGLLDREIDTGAGQHAVGIDFAADGRHLVVANGNGTIYVLRLAGS